MQLLLVDTVINGVGSTGGAIAVHYVAHMLLLTLWCGVNPGSGSGDRGSGGGSSGGSWR